MLFFQILLALLFHPVALILAWINIAGRQDLNGIQKFLWVIVCLIWSIGPILYILIGNGRLW